MARLLSSLLLLICALTGLPAGLAYAEPPPDVRLVFLRHGDLWSATPTGADQQIALATSGSIAQYAIEPRGNRVAVIRRIGLLDALEIHDLVTGEAILVRAAEGFIDALAWSTGPKPSLGYAYTPDRTTPPRVFITQGGAGVQRLVLDADERLLYFYPAPEGVIAILKAPSGLRFLRCTPQASEDIRGFPGKTITAMPIDGRRWIASLYAPGVGRALQMLEPTERGIAMRGEATFERSDLRWSTSPVFANEMGEPLKLVVRADINEPGRVESKLLVWDVARGQMLPIALKDDVLLDTPIAERRGKYLIYCSQFRDGAGYGTPAALWRINWNGEGRQLVIADGQQASWWYPIAPIELATPVIKIPDLDVTPKEEAEADVATPEDETPDEASAPTADVEDAEATSDDEVEAADETDEATSASDDVEVEHEDED